MSFYMNQELFDGSSIVSLTHWGRDKMSTIFQTTFSKAFSWKKMCQFWLKFHWNLFLFLRFQLYNIPALVQIMTWRRPGDKSISKPMMVSLLTHRCVTRSEWVKTYHITRKYWGSSSKKDGLHFADDILKCTLWNKIILHFDLNLIEVCFQRSNWR